MCSVICIYLVLELLNFLNRFMSSVFRPFSLQVLLFSFSSILRTPVTHILDILTSYSSMSYALFGLSIIICFLPLCLVWIFSIDLLFNLVISSSAVFNLLLNASNLLPGYRITISYLYCFGFSIFICFFLIIPLLYYNYLLFLYFIFSILFNVVILITLL